MYNAEGFIINTLNSLKNQNFKDIEIIVVDDSSKYSSIKIIKDYIKIDNRIKLLENNENKGTLFSKSRGILNSKGKYIMILDQDDMLVQMDALSTLYECIELYNLDFLGFSELYLNSTNIIHLNHESIKRMKRNILFSSPIIYQPDIQKLLFIYDKEGIPKRINGVLWNNIYKSKFLKKCIKQIKENFMNTRMNRHEDFLIFFLISRNAYNYKYIKRIFYIHIQWLPLNNSKIQFSLKEKQKNYRNIECLSYLNYIEFLLKNTNNNIYDKRIAYVELNKYYLNHYCRFNIYNKERANRILILFLNNIYIENNAKKRIKKFLNYSILIKL